MRSTDSPARVDAAAQISKAALCMALVTLSGICSNGAAENAGYVAKLQEKDSQLFSLKADYAKLQGELVEIAKAPTKFLAVFLWFFFWLV
jgi:hypothetical protein